MHAQGKRIVLSREPAHRAVGRRIEAAGDRRIEKRIGVLNRERCPRAVERDGFGASFETSGGGVETDGQDQPDAGAGQREIQPTCMALAQRTGRIPDLQAGMPAQQAARVRCERFVDQIARERLGEAPAPLRTSAVRFPGTARRRREERGAVHRNAGLPVAPNGPW